MTPQEKQLLLKDLCARLPYGVKVCARFNTGNRYTANITAICADRDYIQIRQNALHPYTSSSVEDIRPYLRTMSSMTEEEKAFLDATKEIEYTQTGLTGNGVLTLESYDYLNSIHVDYRGLIPMGLALETPEGMYETD